MRNKYAKVSDPNSFVSNPGDKYHVLFEPKVNPDGTVTLVEVGKEDIQEFIDSQLPLTDMSYIIKKLEQGDNSVLNPNIPQYGDFTKVPKTYAEALQLVIDAERDFAKLPIEIRNKFDNDYKQWLATAGQIEWSEKMGFLKKENDSMTVDIKETDQKVEEV